MKGIYLRLALGGVGLLVVAVIALTTLVVSTSAPELPPPPLPTATPRIAVDPNARVQALIGLGQTAEAQMGLTYLTDSGERSGTPACNPHGHWEITINPEDVIGHPYAAMPSPQDWRRASSVITAASGICPVAFVLTWYGHKRAPASTDRWSLALPATRAAGLNGPALQAYAQQHGQAA